MCFFHPFWIAFPATLFSSVLSPTLCLSGCAAQSRTESIGAPGRPAQESRSRHKQRARGRGEAGGGRGRPVTRPRLLGRCPPDRRRAPGERREGEGGGRATEMGDSATAGCHGRRRETNARAEGNVWARNLLPYHSSRLPRLLGFGVRRSVAVEVRTEEAGGRTEWCYVCQQQM